MASREQQVQALACLLAVRRKLEEAANFMAAAANSVDKKPIKAPEKLLQRAYDKIEFFVNELVEPQARSEFAMQLAQWTEEQLDSEEESAREAGGPGEGREDCPEGGDGRAHAGVGGDRADAGPGDGPGEEAPAAGAPTPPSDEG